MWQGPLTVTVSPSELQRKRTKRLNDFALHRIFLSGKNAIYGRLLHYQSVIGRKTTKNQIAQHHLT